MNFLIVVDMQNDFITGSLGSEAACAIVPAVKEKIKAFDGKIIFTRDTHGDDYLSTQEGKRLPVPHCVKDTHGWQLCEELTLFADNTLDKPSFGSLELPKLIEKLAAGSSIEKIELCGLCTDICVISNAMILKAAFPEVVIAVDGKCCAGTSAEGHINALNAMKSVQIEIL